MTAPVAGLHTSINAASFDAAVRVFDDGVPVLDIEAFALRAVASVVGEPVRTPSGAAPCVTCAQPFEPDQAPGLTESNPSLDNSPLISTVLIARLPSGADGRPCPKRPLHPKHPWYRPGGSSGRSGWPE